MARQIRDILRISHELSLARVPTSLVKGVEGRIGYGTDIERGRLKPRKLQNHEKIPGSAVLMALADGGPCLSRMRCARCVQFGGIEALM